MSRIPAVDPANATGSTKQTLDAIKAKFGMVPNMARTFPKVDRDVEGTGANSR
jgi:hypothetical protein